QIIEHDLQRVFFHPRGVGVVAGERVPIGDEEKAIVLAAVLHLYPIRQRAYVVSEVQLSGGAHAAQHPRFVGLCRLRCAHHTLNKMAWITPITGNNRKSKIRPPNSMNATKAIMPTEP